MGLDGKQQEFSITASQKKYEKFAFFKKISNDESVFQHILCMSALHTIT